MTCRYVIHVLVPSIKIHSVNEVNDVGTEWFRHQPQEFYRQKIYWLIKQYDSCLNGSGAYC